MVKYRHRLNKPMVMALSKMYGLHRQNPCLISEIGLSHSQICNFQKLRYWGIIAKFKDNEGDRKGGTWFITNLGANFLLGRIKLSLRVWSWRGEKTEEESEQVSIFQVDAGYQYRPEWIEEAESIDEPQTRIGRFEG